MARLKPFQIVDGYSEFTDLTDAPANYAGQAGKAIVVKNTEDGLEFGVASGSGLIDGYLPLPEKASDPAYQDNYGSIYTKDVGGTTALFYMDDDGTLSRLDGYDGGGGAGNTLDQAYDEGGAGAGRAITADSGAVSIDASGNMVLDLDGYVALTEVSDPSPLANYGMLYTKDIGGTTALFYMDESGTLSRLDGYGSGGSGNTLDQAYDEGGAGAGRSINADSGPVAIDASGGTEEALNIDGYISLTEITDPTATGDDRGFLYTKNDDAYSTSELFYMDDSGQITQITQDGYLATYNSLRGIRLLEGVELPQQAGSFSIYAKDSNGVTELFGRDSDNNELQMTIQGRLGNGAVAAPGDIQEFAGDITTQVDLDTTDTYKQITPEGSGSYTFVPKSTGLYRVDLQFMAFTTYSANENFLFKVEFDDGVNPVIVVGDSESWGYRLNALQEYANYPFIGVASLVAGTTYAVRAYGKRVGSTSSEMNIPIIGRRPQITVQAITGSGAGGTLVQTDEQFNVSLPTGVNTEVHSLDVTTSENDDVLVIFNGYAKHSTTTDPIPIVTIDVDGTHVLAVTRHKNIAGANTARDNLSFSRLVPASLLGSGTHTIKVKIQSNAAGCTTEDYSYMQTMLIRGGLVPIQDDGYNLLDKPQAFNFIGPNIGVSDNNGTADIEVIPDGYLTLDEMSDPVSVPNAGLVYTKEADGYTELHYADDLGFSTQITNKGSVLYEPENVPILQYNSGDLDVIDIVVGPGANSEMRVTLNNGIRYYSPISLSIDLDLNGYGGLDTGNQANSTWYHVYLVPSTTTGRLSAVASTRDPDAYGGPDGYAVNRWIGAVYNNSSGNIRQFWQVGVQFFQKPDESDLLLFDGTATKGSWQNLTMNLAVAIPVTVADEVTVRAFHDGDGGQTNAVYVEPGNPPGWTPSTASDQGKAVALLTSQDNMQHNASRRINLFDGTLSYYALQPGGSGDINLAIIATAWRASRLNYVP